MAAPQTEIKIYTGIGLDFETGGLDSTKHACTQLAMQAVRLDTWDVTDRYVKYITPYNKQQIGGPAKRKVLKNKRELEEEKEAEQMEYEQAALVYSGITMEMLLNMGVDLKEVATETIEFVKRNTLSKGAQCKPILIGQNITFDVSFLQQLMNYAGLTKEFEKVFAGTKDFYGNFQPHYIDTIDLARLCYADDASVTSYKLELIAERLGIELDDAHDADADVTATLNIARVCSNRLRTNAGGMGVSIQKAEKTRNYFKI
ncbi:exonuclease [Dysgonomonas alginatilytica]|uniref:Exonuclease n=1 Tax=Dysgonomonas alginatilytica TaxID=1605892 RepID=A0A2V3PI76_9BACT|nr:exonuclease domain-containing protein [Dysgonomonas alginatilytica]PXV57424.1 exonuclease [Dysgonomonas alginatilytica]